MTTAVRRAVLRTRRLPGLSALYRGIYAGACAVSARAFQGLPDTSAVYLHRGLSREGWEPGVSDIDLILVREEAEPRDGEGAALSRLDARLRALRRVFPMLGDLWVGSRSELDDYLRWGGLRAWEDAPDWRLLSGRGVWFPGSAESAAKRRWLDPWAWLFTSHVEITRRVLGAGAGHPSKRDAEVRKLYLDAARFSDFILSSGEDALRTRAQVAALSPEVARAEPRELWLDAASRLERASRAALSRVASAASVGAGFPVPLRGSVEEARLRAALARLGSSVRRVVSDVPYHTYLLLGEDASSADYGRAADWVLKNPHPTVTLPLEPAAWALALQSSYLGAPLGWLGSGGGCGSAAGQALFPEWGARALGEASEKIPLLEPRLRWETAAEAAAWMLLWWRYLWIAPGWSNRFVLFHLYTRALGLRLALDGLDGGPFCDWELLAARFSVGCEGELGFSSRLRELLLEEPAGSLDAFSRTSLRPGHLGAVGRLMRGLRGSLAGAAAH